MRAIHHHPIYKRFYGLSFLGFLFGVIYGIFSLTLPLLAEHELSNVALLGVIFALPELVGVLLDVPLGGFANRFGRRHTIFYSGILLALSAAGFALFPHPLVFLLTLIFYEIAMQAYIIPADAELMAISPSRRSGKFNGIVEGLHNFGFSVGPIIAGFLIARSIEYPFWLAFVLSLLLAGLSFRFLRPEASAEPFTAAVEHLWRRDRIFRSSISEFLELGFVGMFTTFLFLFLRSGGGSLHFWSRSILTHSDSAVS
ncbi:MAG: hypothetical protein A3A44_02240 [Candidatus Sungbacteria bacterium RIFCSPLOWO2_01_FULL_60_25]|uniref:Major facilitator superfamily (MFS) profile domain-containing protein n=1 Tax=Candidatus Sungbacteria bacterium RIFCSPLOWO2_01_FULL_60_25 TaxID=1802281 RepID=A0A1G2LBC0_9BACT|nr:MAG: hypothetical protein A3A44_02240 [Candidatus Sungbacteria bacterium RIFCSPLOWO2_01_FULL_60_25]